MIRIIGSAFRKFTDEWYALAANAVFLTTTLDEYLEYLPIRPSKFRTTRCRKLKIWFHVQLFVLNKTKVKSQAIAPLIPEF